MTNKINTYYKLQDELDDFAYDLFKYIKSNYLDLLEFGTYSAYEKFKIDDNTFYIKYYDRGYDIYECNFFAIPINKIGNAKQYIDDYAEEKFQYKLKKQKEEEEQAKQARYEQFQKLRQEFEIQE